MTLHRARQKATSRVSMVVWGTDCLTRSYSSAWTMPAFRSRRGWRNTTTNGHTQPLATKYRLHLPPNRISNGTLRYAFFRWTGHCLSCAHARQSCLAPIPTGGRWGVTSYLVLRSFQRLTDSEDPKLCIVHKRATFHHYNGVSAVDSTRLASLRCSSMIRLLAPATP